MDKSKDLNPAPIVCVVYTSQSGDFQIPKLSYLQIKNPNDVNNTKEGFVGGRDSRSGGTWYGFETVKTVQFPCTLLYSDLLNAEPECS